MPVMNKIVKNINSRRGIIKPHRLKRLWMLTPVIAIVSMIVFTTGCQEQWNDHYKTESKIVSDLNVLEYLKSKPEYSEFVKVLENTGVADELTRDQDLTVWAVNNESFANFQDKIIDSDTFTIEYHINNLSISLGKMFDGQRLPSLNGKYIPITINTEDTLITKSSIVKANQFCSNGIVHEINSVMTPTISIYEYLQNLGDDYSIIVDSLFSQNDTIFDLANSVPIGVDETGNTIYDSVFVVDNPIFEVVDFRSEFEQITMFLPNNDVLNNCLTNYVNQLNGMGEEITLEDSVTAFDWIKSALFYDGIVKDYGSELDIESLDGSVWRTSVQEISANSNLMSNGLVYDITKMKIPNNIFIKRIKSLFHYIEYIPQSERDNYIEYLNTITAGVASADNASFPDIGIASWTYKIIKLAGSISDDQPAGFETTPIKIETLEDNTTLGSEMLIPPGEYKFYLGFRSKNHANINVYVNGIQIAEDLSVTASTPWNYDRVTQTYPGTKWDGLGGLVNIVDIPGVDMASIKIKIEFSSLSTGTKEEIQAYHWAMVPTENNY